MQNKNTKPQEEITTSAKRLAFNHAFEACGEGIWRYFAKRIKNQHDAEELFSIFWEKVYRQFPPEKFNHMALLQYKAKQVISNYYRHKGVRSIVEYTDRLPEQVAPSAPPESGDPAEEEALKERFWALFPGITPSEQEKELFWLKERQGYTFKEIAERLAIAVTTVQDRYNKLQRMLLEAYQRE